MVERGVSTKSVKISRYSSHLGEMEGNWKCKSPLRGPAQKLTWSQALNLGPGRGTAAWRCQRYTVKDWVVWLQDEIWRDSHHLPCVEPHVPPTWPNMFPHWPGEQLSLHPSDSLRYPSTHLANTSDNFMLGNQLHPTLSTEGSFYSN